MLAKICVLYGLHERLDLPERQAASLRNMQSVQASLFKAYVGGVYRDQGLEAVSKWLNLLLTCHVEAAYQTVRKEYLLPPTTAALPYPVASSTHYPTPPSPTASSSTLPQEELVGSRPEGIDRPNLKRCGSPLYNLRNLPKQEYSSRYVEGRSSRRPSSSLADPDTIKSARKRMRFSDEADV